MNGLEISRGFFEEYGKPMLERDFADILPYIAAGFVGSGSEHLGYDDEISQDHDFEPGFCIFLPSEEVVDRRTAFLLERAYESFIFQKQVRLTVFFQTRHGLIFLTMQF